MDILRLDGPFDETLKAPVLLVALDGWTDAGRAGSIAAETLREQWAGRRVAAADPDQLFDFRDRRPILTIDRGMLGDPVWPSLELFQLHAEGSGDVLLLQGGEPDLSWRRLCADLVELAEVAGIQRYIGVGAVPAPTPHTRATRLITTGSTTEVFERYGRPHEHLTVPASCQVVIETALRDVGVATIGLWARIPHYVAGEYPDAGAALARAVAEEVGAEVDIEDLVTAAAEHRERLDAAATASDEITAHIGQLEAMYDADMIDDFGLGPLPTGDEIAAEFERFLRRGGE